MKAKTILLSLFFLFPSIIYCQNNQTQILQGSWMGRVITDQKNCGGYLYMSKEYLLLKTISVMVNKGGIPKEIKDKFTAVL